ncbi:hypothetical protein STA3757_29780 [Stanieria sp. NIES-3757]|nr:hypothetical protein STA3757_29780 [Stanieria sp. NIES-3757]
MFVVANETSENNPLASRETEILALIINQKQWQHLKTKTDF